MIVRSVGKKDEATGVSSARTAMPPNPPMPVSTAASYPRRCRRYFCPGRTTKMVESSGAARKMLGMVLSIA